MCKARVKEVNGLFYPGDQQHCHPPVVGVTQISKVKATLRTRAKAEPFVSGVTIAEAAMRDHINPDAPFTTLPAQTILARTANRVCQAMRPTHPFDLHADHAIPDDFMIADITVRERRHLMFSTPEQLELLAKSKHWIVDGTFRLVKEPYTQVFKCHFVMLSCQENPDWITRQCSRPY